MSIPSFQALLLPVLRALNSQADIPLPIADIRERVRRSEKLDESDCREMLPSGRQAIFDNRIHWALTHLTKAGLIDRPRRGHCALTDSGKNFLAESPTQLDVPALCNFSGYKEWRSTFGSSRTGGNGDSLEGDETDERTPMEEIETAAVKLRNMLEAEVLESVRKCRPDFLEKVVVDLLIAMGYGGGDIKRAAVTGGSGDGGVDGKVREDALGLDEIYVQAKRYGPSHSVGEPDLRSFTGALDASRTNKGVFVTTSDFSEPARNFVRRTQKSIILIDGKKLARLMVLHGVGVRLQTTYEVKQIDKDYYLE